jgi:hypothetical protein
VPDPRVSAQTHHCPKFGPRMGVSSPPDTFGSARWALFFQPLYPVGQKRTHVVCLGRPAGDGLKHDLNRTVITTPAAMHNRAVQLR